MRPVSRAVQDCQSLAGPPCEEKCVTACFCHRRVPYEINSRGLHEYFWTSADFEASLESCRGMPDLAVPSCEQNNVKDLFFLGAYHRKSLVPCLKEYIWTLGDVEASLKSCRHIFSLASKSTKVQKYYLVLSTINFPMVRAKEKQALMRASFHVADPARPW